MFAKNKREVRQNPNLRIRHLLILILSVASIRRKWSKTLNGPRSKKLHFTNQTTNNSIILKIDPLSQIGRGVQRRLGSRGATETRGRGVQFDRSLNYKNSGFFL